MRSNINSYLEDYLKRGGEMADCKTQAQRSCRVPIRVVLQPLGGGAEAGDAKVAGLSSSSSMLSASMRDPQGSRHFPSQANEFTSPLSR